MKMKNKRQEEIANRKRHLEGLKKRRQEPMLERATPSKLEKPIILIVCEGKNTEPSYFEQFRLSSATLITLGNGYNGLSLVNETLKKRQRKKYDQVWSVFDKDNISNNDFNNAVTLAVNNGIGVAYSNQAFEYWLILHFEDHQGGGMARTEYGPTLNEYLEPLGAIYEADGSKKVSRDVFEILEANDPHTGIVRRDLAIRRAKRNFDRLDHASPATEESSTTVFKLVEEIMKYI